MRWLKRGFYIWLAYTAIWTAAEGFLGGAVAWLFWRMHHV